MNTYDTITALIQGRERGDFIQEELEIELDNNYIFFSLPSRNDYSSVSMRRDIFVVGYYPTMELLSFLFPKARVQEI